MKHIIIHCIVLCSILSCRVNVEPMDYAAGDPKFYFKGSFNDNEIDLKHGENGYLISAAMEGFGSSDYEFALISTIRDAVYLESDEHTNLKTMCQIGFGLNYEDEWQADFISFIKKGNQNFALYDEEDSLHTNGVLIQLILPRGDAYTSNSVHGQPSSAYFTIARVEQTNDERGILEIEGSFSCYMYDSNGDSILFTSSAFYLPVLVNEYPY